LAAVQGCAGLKAGDLPAAIPVVRKLLSQGDYDA
jgi:hypothetical protein